MGRDFGDDVLPLKDGFLQASNYDPSAIFSWTETQSAMLDLLNYVVKKQMPGWGHPMNDGMYAVIAYLPSASRMGVTWTSDMRMIGSPTGNTLLSKYSRTQLVSGSFRAFERATSS